MKVFIWTCCVGLLLLAGIPGALAQTADFEEHYQQGRQLAKAGQFAAALHAFEQAYRLNKLSTLGINIGLLHLKLQHAEQAQKWCQQYMREEPNPPEEYRAKASTCISQAQALLRARPVRPAAPSIAHPTATPVAAVKNPPAPVGPPVPTPPAQTALPAPIEKPLPPQESGPLTAQAEPPAQPVLPTEVAAGKPAIRLIPPKEVTPVATTGISSAPSPAPLGSSFQPVSSLPSPPAARPIYKKWWFWTIIGVAAAGAVTGITVGVLSANNKTDNVIVPDPLAGIPVENRRVIEF